MRLKTIKGKLIFKNVKKYKIDWDGSSRSKFQFNVKQFLKPFWINNIVYEEFPVYGTKMRVDILNATKYIAIEVQGAQHDKFTKHFHGNKMKWRESIGRDFAKQEWLTMNNFQLIEIYPEDLNLLSREYILEKFGIDIY